ncbi:hypothetical protein ACIQCF_32835 [Streptomyces sp. NPDC088353]|uniref:hypothetical protein n=1 Tax=unclassified Streptomyces TaxID=2593676 RepID=UPI00367CE26A
MAQARAEGGFTATHEAFCSAAKTKAGGHEGTRVLIEVLLSHRQLPAAAVVGGMQAVLGFDSVGIDLVAIAARRRNATCEEMGDSPAEGARNLAARPATATRSAPARGHDHVRPAAEAGHSAPPRRRARAHEPR